MDLVVTVYRESEKMPATERFALISERFAGRPRQFLPTSL